MFSLDAIELVGTDLVLTGVLGGLGVVGEDVLVTGVLEPSGVDGLEDGVLGLFGVFTDVKGDSVPSVQS